MWRGCCSGQVGEVGAVVVVVGVVVAVDALASVCLILEAIQELVRFPSCASCFFWCQAPSLPGRLHRS